MDRRQVLDKTFAWVRDITRDQFELFVKDQEAEVAAFEVMGLPFLQQMTHIMVFGPEIEVNFKTHFMLSDVRRMTQRKTGAAEVSDIQAIDFMKEFCNVVAGKVKLTLTRGGFSLGQSLPFSILGYNEVFYPKEDRGSLQTAWRVRGRDGFFNCSATIVVPGADEAWSRLESVKYLRDESEAQGDVELF